MTGTWGVETLDRLARRVLDSPPSLGPVRLVAVDGFAGAGKTTLAGRLGHALGAQVVHTDDLLGGWVDTVGFWARLERWVLAPLRDGRPGRYRRYDWDRASFAEWHDVPLAPALVVEGVTSARAVVRPECTLSLWVEAPKALRTARGVARDGELVLPEWLAWQDREEAHVRADRTPQHVDLVVDGDPRRRLDPDAVLVRVPGRGGERAG